MTRLIRAELLKLRTTRMFWGSVAAALVIAEPWLASHHVDVTSHGADLAIVLVGGIAATAISGMVGVGFGALVRNQTGAVTIALVWVLIAAYGLTFAAAGSRFVLRRDIS